MTSFGWKSIVIASILACCGCDSGKGGGSARPSVGEQLVVAIPDSPEFLTEEMALSAAQGTLDMVRLWRTNWHPVPEDRTAAPDGRRDHFLTRNTSNPNRGVIAFTNGASTWYVSVQMRSNLLFLQCSASK
jgi:hypothetical protein